MDITNARATYGLSATGSLAGTGVDGSLQLGTISTTARLTDSDVAYIIRAILAKTSDALVVDLTDGDTTGSTTWVAGEAQIETATIVAAGGATSSGNMVLVVTSAGMTGSPLNVPVALVTATHTTAALIASAARTALESVAVIAARFTVGGTGANIALTRKPLITYTEASASIPVYSATDGTFNIAVPGGLGVTEDLASTSTAAGTETSGAKIYVNYPGVIPGGTIPAIVTMRGVLISCADGGANITCDTYAEEITVGNILPKLGGTLSRYAVEPMTLTAVSTETDLSITVIGKTT